MNRLSVPTPSAVNFLLAAAALVAPAAVFAVGLNRALPNKDGPRIALLSEFRPIGASGNNLVNPGFDPVPGSPELSIAPLNFAAGSANGLITGPNARTISNVIAGGSGGNGQNDETTDPTASAWLYVFGQFTDHDLDLEETPPTSPSIAIAVPPGDPVFAAGTSIMMSRAVRSPITNTILNSTAGYLDLSQLYGSAPAEAAAVQNADGTLLSSDNGAALPVANGQFFSGDPRVTENPELTALTTLFMREHNYWVSYLRTQNPAWTPAQLYGMARAITTAEYQNIIYTEYLPLLIGPVIPPYAGYNAAVNAQVTQEFSTAAFRVGHSQVSDTEEGLDNTGQLDFSQPLAVAFFNTPAENEDNGIDALVRGVSADFAQATDVYAVSQLRDLLFAPLVGGDIDEMDLIAIDIQRERDVGLGTLNQTRRALGLAPYSSFAALTPDTPLQANLAAVYGNIGSVDLFMGGLAESPAAGAIVGPTFQAIIAQQFRALRDGDRFFWLNQNFDSATAAMIAKTTLATIILRNTDTASLQSHVFLAAPQPPVFPQPVFVGKTAPQTIAAGQTAVFNAAATGSPAPTYQWTLNGSTAIPGAAGTTDSILLITGATTADAGSYVCTATNSEGVTSTSATLTVIASSTPGRLVNLSGRGYVGSTPASALFGGFSIAGGGSKEMLVRGMGPGLATVFSVDGSLAEPLLTLYDGKAVQIGQNKGWGGTPILANAVSAVGAFTVPLTSLDSMLLTSLPAAAYTCTVTGASGDTGVAMVELYDADGPGAVTRLANISARAAVGTGANILIGGFSIAGSTSETVLIRAIGPGLASSLGGTLAQPVLSVFDSGGNMIYSNTGWGGDPTLASVSDSVGASKLSPSSQDSVLLVSLPAGSYSAQVSGLNNGTGVALFELYEVP